ncbi:MAG: GGDEF domain-containing protein [Sulfurimonas sp.]|nr:GGDEF domain-containing protein [Sulfurimonas sp.]
MFTNQYELALATGNSFVIAMCDLDYFKNINDTYGHVAGDQLLKLFVNIVKKTLRNSDVIIRYGGEEFLMILPSITQVQGVNVLEKIREEFSKSSLEFNDTTISCTVSIGMLEIRPKFLFNEKFIDKYLTLADQNLYLAKERGRNRVMF